MFCMLKNWFAGKKSSAARRCPHMPRKHGASPPCLECLEDRTLLSGMLPISTGNNISLINNSSFAQSAQQSVSANGQYVVFSSSADNLKPGFPTGQGIQAVYRRDLVNGTTDLVSVNLAGNADPFTVSNNAVMTRDGRYVAFNSNSTHLTTNDTSGGVFVRDMQQGKTYLISLGINYALYPSIAETGSGQLVIAYQNSTPNAINDQVYLTRFNLDSSGAIQSGSIATRLVTASSAGTGANGGSIDAVLSRDGSTLAFASNATNLPGERVDPHPYGGNFKLFIYNVASGTLNQVSPAPPAGGYDTVGVDSFTLSANGQFVAYQNRSVAANGIAAQQILVWNSATGKNTVIAHTAPLSFTQVGEPFISGDGSTVAYVATNNLGFLFADVFIASNWQSGIPQIRQLTHNEQHALSNANTALWPTLSDNGQVVAFQWQNSADVNARQNLFVTNLKTGVTQQAGSFVFGKDGYNRVAISTDGSVVVFNSSAIMPGITDFVPYAGSSGADNVFGYNVSSSAFSLVSAAPGDLAPPIRLNPAALLPATIGKAFSQTIAASGGTGTLTLAVSNIKNRIAGLNIAASGPGTLGISGTPTTTGTETFTVTATDQAGGTEQVQFSITVSNPVRASVKTVSITYGTALDNRQLSGTASSLVNGYAINVPGTFSFTSAAGAMLIPGVHSRTVTFTPNDTTRFLPVTSTVTVTVARARPQISIGPITIPSGMKLSNSQFQGWTASSVLNGETVNVSGTFTFATTTGTLAVGTHSVPITFTPSDQTNYQNVTGTVTVRVV